MYMVDSDILIDVLRGYPPATQWLDVLANPPAVPGFVALELYAGCTNKIEAHQVRKLLRRFPVVWASESDCQQMLQSFASRHLSHRLGVMDALIGACALGHNAILCTFNVKHFQSIPGLVTEQPYPKSP